MLENKIKISVIIPFYNNVEWLKEAVESAISQTYKNIEVLIVNDGSEFDLHEIKLLDSRIKTIYKKNGGPASARNVGLKASTGDYIAFLDSDDIWMNNKLEIQLEYMLQNNFKWSHHSYQMFTLNSDKPFKTVCPSDCRGDVLKNTYLSFRGQTSSFMIEKKLLVDQNIYFPENRRYGQDIFFFREIAKLEKLGFLSRDLSKFRIRGNNAGFRPEVQIKFRYLSGLELKTNPELRKSLPKIASVGYSINEILYVYMKNLKISKFLYFIPYIMFKVGSITNEGK